jgi:hypothetical protein
MINAYLQRQMKIGAVNFYWIGGLSLANSTFFVFKAKSSSLISLRITQFIDTIAYNIAHFFPNSVLSIQAVGLIPVFFICCVFFVCGYLAIKGYRMAFTAGMILYGLDALLTLVSADVFGFVFHVFFLWFLFRGLQACKNLKRVMPPVTLNTTFPKYSEHR